MMPAERLLTSYGESSSRPTGLIRQTICPVGRESYHVAIRRLEHLLLCDTLKGLIFSFSRGPV